MERLNLKNFFSRLKFLPLFLVPMVAFAAIKYDDMILSSSLKVGGTAVSASNLALDVASTTKGVIFPRMTNTQRDAIAAPATGTMIFSTTDNTYEFYNGSAWTTIGGGVGVLTANRGLVSDGSGNLVVATTTATEIGYVNGVTSAIQTQLNLKAPLASPTFSGTTTFSGLTATTVPYLDASKVLTSSAVTPTELGYLTGVTSAIQTQFTGKASTTLNNLGTTSINAALLASAANSWDIGSAANYFKNAYALTHQTVTDAGSFVLNPTDTNTTGTLGWETGLSSYVLRSKQSDTAAGRTLSLVTDSVAGANASATGGINITTGNKTAGTGSSGPITLTTGTSSGGAKGRVNIVDGTDGFAGMVWTTNNNAGGGHWMKPTGDINFIANPDAEFPDAGTAGTPAWATYADAAGVSPVDGTGGAPTVTWTRTTSSPLAGAASFLFTKDAANRQGNGSSYDFSIRTADRAKVMQVEFDYAVASGTFAAGSTTTDSDIEIFVYDVTNSALVPLTTYKLFSSSTSPPNRFIANFQSASNSSNYRLIFHTATTSASAYTVLFDNITTSPSKYIYGTPITDWVSYTPSWTAVSVNPAIGNGTIQGFYRRVGDSAEIQIMVFSGTTTTYGTGNYIFSIPANLVMDTAKLPTAANFPPVGYGYAFVTGTSTNYAGIAYYKTTTTVSAIGAATAGTWGGTIPATPTASTAGTSYALHLEVPIVGWSSQVQMSDSAPQAVIAAHYATVGGVLATSANGVIKYTTQVFDTTGSYSASTGLYTCPVSGYYRVTNYLNGSNAPAAGIYSYVGINGSTEYKRLVTPHTASGGNSGSALVPCTAGQTLGIYSSSATLAISDGAAFAWVMFERISGPVSIGATETVAARYTTTNAISTATAGSSVITWVTKDYDTHGAMNAATGVYTVPISGKYRVTCNAITASIAFTAGSSRYALLTLTGTKSGNGPASPIWASVTTLLGLTLNGTWNYAAGDTISCTLTNQTGSTISLDLSAPSNYISIERVGM